MISSRLRPGHGGSGASCSIRAAAPAAAHAADDLAAGLARLGPDVRAVRRLIAAGPAAGEGH